MALDLKSFLVGVVASGVVGPPEVELVSYSSLPRFGMIGADLIGFLAEGLAHGLNAIAVRIRH